MPTTDGWTHRYQGVCAHGILVATMGFGSPTHPDGLTQRSLDVETQWCGTKGCRVTLTYVASWDHEPTDAEVDAVTPEGFRDSDAAELNDRCDECMDGRHTNCTDVEDSSCCCPDESRHYFTEEDDGG